MEKIDIRQLSDRERALLRKQVIRLRKQGQGNKEVAELFGVICSNNEPLVAMASERRKRDACRAEKGPKAW